jgi:hypothetical protein
MKVPYLNSMEKFETFDTEQMGTLDKTYALLMEEKESIEMDDFEDLYDVKSDKEHVEDLLEKFEQDNTPEDKEAARVAEILELIYTDSAERGRWMGDEAMIRNTSKYDDLVNGIDMVAEFYEKGKFSHLGLAIDVTFSKDIANKLRRIRDEILNGELAKVKYYLSEDAGIRGELSNIPHVIAGTNLPTIKELSRLWFQKRQLSESIDRADQPESVQKAMQEKLKEAIEDLKKHDIQHKVLRQIEFQLEKLIEFAEKEKKLDVAEKLKASLEKVQQIIELKKTPKMEDDFLVLLEEEIEKVFK